jgi:hypothetical protein
MRNYQTSLEKLGLILELEEKINPNTITGYAILSALREKNTSASNLLRYIKDQATDSRKTMLTCIPEELLDKILKIKL